MTSEHSRRAFLAAGAVCMITLSGCNNDKPRREEASVDTTEPQWIEGEFRPASEYAQRCATPKSGLNAFTGQPYDHVHGTEMHEKMWLRSWSNEVYLWYDELPDSDPKLLDRLTYFNSRKTAFDRFHYAEAVESFTSSQAGVFLSYGIRLREDKALQVLRVADVESNYALDAQLQRGDVLVGVDGVDLFDHTEADVAIIHRGLNPTAGDPSHILVFADAESMEQKTLMLTARALEHNPVPRYSVIDHNGTAFGYLQFDAHSSIAEPRLIEAVSELRETGVDELILDLRYNYGGYLYLASQLSYMIAGAGSTDGMPFIYPRYNDKHQTTSPIDGRTTEPLMFITEGYTGEQEAPLALPTLDLNRVYILTSNETCSASEAIINGLKGVGVEVVQVGASTCGKPYTFFPEENCGIVYQTVVFSNENAMGFGDYINGFRPTHSQELETATELPGCFAEENFNHQLGSAEETLVATALHWHDSGTCPSLSHATVTVQRVQLPRRSPLRALVPQASPAGALLSPEYLKRD